MRRGSHLWTCCTLTNPLCERARTWQLDFYIDVYSRPIRHGFLRLRAASCGREVGVGLGNLQAGRSLARSFVRCNSLSFPPFFIYLFFFPFFLFFLFFLFYSSFFPSPSPSLPVSLALLPRPSRFSRCRAALDRAYLLLRGCSGDRRPSVNIVWLLLRRTFERWQRA